MKKTILEIGMDRDSIQQGAFALLEHFAINPVSQEEQTLELSLGIQAVIACLRSITNDVA